MSDTDPADNGDPKHPTVASAGNGGGVAGGGGTTRLEYARPTTTGRLRRWARDKFSREQLVAGVKQLAWVAPLTVLIWVWAEREQKIPANNIRFPVEVTTSNPKLAVSLVDPEDGYVSVDLMGARAELDKLRNLLGSRSAPVRFEVSPDVKEGERQVPLNVVIDRDSRFDGVDLTTSQPRQITIFVDTVIEEEVEVKVRPEDAGQFLDPRFDPPRVRVRMPRRARDQAAGETNGRLVAYAALGSLPDQTPGEKTNVSGVRVMIANARADDVQIEPQTVTASYRVSERAREYTINTLPIRESVPTDLREKIAVRVSPAVMFNVKVSGPPDVIDEIERLDAAQLLTQGSLVMAHVSITAEDHNKNQVMKNVWFTLPEGVKLVEPPKTPVEVTITPRASGGPAD